MFSRRRRGSGLLLNRAVWLGVWLAGSVGLASASGGAFGLSAEEAHALKTGADGDRILLLDVRDPVEIMFTGGIDLADFIIPFRLVDTTSWSEGSGTFPMPLNPAFVSLVKEALARRGLDHDTMIITICRSGSARGEPSARALRDHGFSNSYFVEFGFEGDPATEGPQRGLRVVNGWKNSGLPWTSRMSRDKLLLSAGDE
ncbi:MAG TPA: rhodanese-like domain-containing protein [Kiritimatiellia bacterium]|nr:rhodanese-like domain-containing protein [Kiritimatiellia bacterium]